jgi:hypothetical protein
MYAHRVRRTLLPIAALVVGLAVGGCGSGQSGAVSASSHEMIAELTPQSSYACPNLTTKTFALRAPGNGLTEGRVLALADSFDAAGCTTFVTFTISPALGFFVVSDGSASWGPFSYDSVKRSSWTLKLVVSNG